MSSYRVGLHASSFLLLFMIGLCVAGGEFCYNGVTLDYCDFGCCSGTCCFLSAWLIGVIVIGCIISFFVIVAIVCCVVKSKGSSGRVVQPMAIHPAQHVTVVNPPGTTAWGQQTAQPGPGPYNYRPNPPPYGAATAPPAYTDPAYPPAQSGQPAADPSPFALAAGQSVK